MGDSKILVNVTPGWTKRLTMYMIVREKAPADRKQALNESLFTWYQKEVQTFVESAATKVYICWLNEFTAVLFNGIFSGAVPLGVAYWSDNYYLVPSMSLR